MEQVLTMKELPVSERPYEKLEKYGPQILSDAELLAIIIKTGSNNEKSTDLAARIIGHSGEGLLGLHQLSMEDFQKIKGIGRVKSIQLKALSELSKRIAYEQYKEKVQVSSPGSVAALYMEHMRHLSQEQLMVVLLNTKHQIMKEKVLSIGTVNASLIHPREVFIYALKEQAVSVIILHNHPSGNPEPSHEDLAVTNRLKEAGDIIGINLVDHLIIGDGRYVSLREQGYI